ncbi:MAG: 16S rRNA (adenine(1518)-N(6)/adenine(1519)-N(6))-dimethyltransferase RsmA [Methanobacteriaceae archaeon]
MNSKNSSELSLAQETKELLKENGIRLKRSLGQNYLIDDFKRKKIISFAELNKEDVVLEIGSGIGTLTLELAKKVKKVISIEQDPTIFKILEKRINESNINNVKLILGDAVKIDFPKFNKVVSNLPYKISSPITFKLLEYDFEYAILMYQKEFVDRMVAKSGKDYSRLSAMLYFNGDVKVIDKVPPQAFIPQPRVNSAVIKLTKITPNSKAEITMETLKLYKKHSLFYSKVCKSLFQHKKKKVRNALIDSAHEIDQDKKELKKKLNKILNDEYTPNNIDYRDLTLFKEDLAKRTVTMSPIEILNLTVFLEKIIKNNKDIKVTET